MSLPLLYAPADPPNPSTLCRAAASTLRPPALHNSYSNGGSVTSCLQCPEGTTTAQGGASALAECLAKPGYGYSAGTISACPVGTYKFALGSFECASCGTGLATNSTASTSYNDCYIPTGWGATVVSYEPFLLAANRCLTGTYGAAAPVYGPRSTAYACAKCPLYMTTNDTNPVVQNDAALLAAVVNASPGACLTAPGYGYNATTNTAYECPSGFNSTGYTRDPCTAV